MNKLFEAVDSVRAYTLDEAKVTDYIDSDRLGEIVSSNSLFGDVQDCEPLEGMILKITSRAGISYYKVIKNDDGEFEAYIVDQFGKQLGDPFLLEVTNVDDGSMADVGVNEAEERTFTPEQEAAIKRLMDRSGLSREEVIELADEFKRMTTGEEDPDLERRTYSTKHQDKLEDEYKKSHTNEDGSVDWSDWEDFTASKMDESESSEEEPQFKSATANNVKGWGHLWDLPYDYNINELEELFGKPLSTHPYIWAVEYNGNYFTVYESSDNKIRWHVGGFDKDPGEDFIRAIRKIKDGAQYIGSFMDEDPEGEYIEDAHGSYKIN